MTIDERLEKLAERHEALTQTVELIAAMQRDNEERFTQIGHNFEAVHDSIKRLENIAVAHEHRIDRLEQP
jgi:uncharacterized protein YdcH (DUF465 family)